jgi:phytoene dehydrogenase-like protein
MYHVSGMKRPRGGSGMLTQALVRMIEAHGGRVLTGTPVEQIVVEAGRAVGARAADGTVYTAARAVVSGAHIHTTIRLLGEAAPPALRSLVRRARTGNGFGMIVRLAVDQLPDYLTAPTGGEAGEHHRAMQFICPSLEYLERAYADYLAGRPSREPGVIAMTWSAADPTLAPPGKHVVFLWGQYYPFRLADGASWDEIGDREADRLLEVLRAYAPNMTAERVIGRLVETPLYLERELGLINGNVMHLEMSVDQMFMLRPALTLGRYRLPINGLYVTGASTHPGGGIMGAAGRNTAAAVLADLDRPAFLRRSRTR